MYSKRPLSQAKVAQQKAVLRISLLITWIAVMVFTYVNEPWAVVVSPMVACAGLGSVASTWHTLGVRLPSLIGLVASYVMGAQFWLVTLRSTAFNGAWWAVPAGIMTGTIWFWFFLNPPTRSDCEPDQR